MSLSEVRKRTAEVMRQSPIDPPCTFCGKPTPWATLSNLGARCEDCYANFCRHGPELRLAPKALPRKRTPDDAMQSTQADRAVPAMRALPARLASPA